MKRKRTCVRIWIWWNESPVRITLKPNEPFELCSGGPCDEGYSYSSEVYEWDTLENVILNQCTTNAMDCDGRLSRCWDGEWKLDGTGETRPMMDFWNGNDDDVLTHNGVALETPTFVECGHSQRDYAAEAMGY